MSARPLSLVSSLLFVATVPLVWAACGGGSKPPETPADESSNGEGGAAEPASSAAAASSAAPDNSAAASSGDNAAPAASSPPPAPAAPAMSDSDCGKCIDKTCAKPAAACGKNTDCQATIDAFHGCGSDKGAATCIGNASIPTAAKPKKLANAYAACVKKAATSKACKQKCQ